jgi:6-phosphofructokinase 1
MKKIAVITSGGDAPGMNAGVRAVARRAASMGCRVIGYECGWKGVLDGVYQDLELHSAVSNIIQRGGTILKSSRCERFYKREERVKAHRALIADGVEGLIALGGDGTFRGLHRLIEETNFPGIGIPATIDNDLYGSDATIGFDTAINTALEAIDRIRDTAESHERVFFVEVMGRDFGHIALDVGIAGGADAILLPETKTDLKELAFQLEEGKKRGCLSNIVIISEGDEKGGALKTAAEIEELTNLPHRVCILGHLQRGGRPTARDRILATKLGGAAVDCLLSGQSGIMVGEQAQNVVEVSLPLTWNRKKSLDRYLLELFPSLTRRSPGAPPTVAPQVDPFPLARK